MYSERISRLGGISERTIIENNSLRWKIPRSFAARSVNAFFVPKVHRSGRPPSLPRAFAPASSAAANSPSSKAYRRAQTARPNSSELSLLISGTRSLRSQPDRREKIPRACPGASTFISNLHLEEIEFRRQVCERSWLRIPDGRAASVRSRQEPQKSHRHHHPV